MATTFHCPRGHEWSASAGEAARQDRCPRCDAPALETAVSHDSAGPIPPLPDPPSELPRVPGYEVLAELGRGGMGVVYKARQVGLGRVVALKMIRADCLPSAEDVARFKAEAEAVARMGHPNVVHVYEWGEHHGQPYFSMELVDGGSLDRRLAATPQPAKWAAALLETLARAVHAVHQKGVVHRDLKPGNVLLAADGAPKVSDFGLVKRLDARGTLNPSGAVVGTPSYMPPEQASGMGVQVGPPADVWALGAILYECLTGRPPFLAETPFETLMQVMSREPVPPRTLQPGLPRDLETICLKCLQKEREKRYATALELADDLRRFLDGVPIKARPIGPLGRLTRACRRHPLIATLTAAVVAAVVAGFAGVSWQWREAVTARDQAARDKDKAERNYAVALDTNLAIADLGEELKALAGSQPGAVERILGVAGDRYERLLAEAGESPAALAGKAKMLNTFSEVYIEVNDTGKALAAAQQAGRLFERLLADQPDNLDWQAGWATSRERQAVATSWRGNAAEALRLHREALAKRRELLAVRPGDPALRFDLARGLHHVGNVLTHQGDSPRARQHWQEARDLRQRLHDEGTLKAKGRLGLATSLEKFADAAFNDSDMTTAAAGYQKALALLDEVLAARPDDPEANRHRPRLRSSLGSTFRWQGKDKEAAAELQAARRLLDGLVQTQPRNVSIRLDLLQCRMQLADMRRGQELVPALREMLDALAAFAPIVEEMKQKDPANAVWRLHRANVRGVTGYVLTSLVRVKAEPREKLDEALALLRQAQAEVGELLVQDPTNWSFAERMNALNVYANLALAAKGDARGAAAEMAAQQDRRVGFYLRRAGEDAGHGWWRHKAAETLRERANSRFLANRYDDSTGDFRAAREHYKALERLTPARLAEWRVQWVRAGYQLAEVLDEQARAKAVRPGGQIDPDAVVREMDRAGGMGVVREAVRSAEELHKGDPKHVDGLRVLVLGYELLEGQLRQRGDHAGADARLAERLRAIDQLMGVDREVARHYPFRPGRKGISTAADAVEVHITPAPFARQRVQEAERALQLHYRESREHELIEASAALVDALDAADAAQAAEMRTALRRGLDVLRRRQGGHPVYARMAEAFERRLKALPPAEGKGP